MPSPAQGYPGSAAWWPRRATFGPRRTGAALLAGRASAQECGAGKGVGPGRSGLLEPSESQSGLWRLPAGWLHASDITPQSCCPTALPQYTSRTAPSFDAAATEADLLPTRSSLLFPLLQQQVPHSFNTPPELLQAPSTSVGSRITAFPTGPSQSLAQKAKDRPLVATVSCSELSFLSCGIPALQGGEGRPVLYSYSSADTWWQLHPH